MATNFDRMMAVLNRNDKAPAPEPTPVPPDTPAEEPKKKKAPVKKNDFHGTYDVLLPARATIPKTRGAVSAAMASLREECLRIGAEHVHDVVGWAVKRKDNTVVVFCNTPDGEDTFDAKLLLTQIFPNAVTDTDMGVLVAKLGKSELTEADLTIDVYKEHAEAMMHKAHNGTPVPRFPPQILLARIASHTRAPTPAKASEKPAEEKPKRAGAPKIEEKPKRAGAPKTGDEPKRARTTKTEEKPKRARPGGGEAPQKKARAPREEDPTSLKTIPLDEWAAKIKLGPEHAAMLARVAAGNPGGALVGEFSNSFVILCSVDVPSKPPPDVPRPQPRLERIVAEPVVEEPAAKAPAQESPKAEDLLDVLESVDGAKHIDVDAALDAFESNNAKGASPAHFGTLCKQLLGPPTENPHFSSWVRVLMAMIIDACDAFDRDGPVAVLEGDPDPDADPFLTEDAVAAPEPKARGECRAQCRALAAKLATNETFVQWCKKVRDARAVREFCEDESARKFNFAGVAASLCRALRAA